MDDQYERLVEPHTKAPLIDCVFYSPFWLSLWHWLKQTRQRVGEQQIALLQREPTQETCTTVKMQVYLK